MPESGLQTANAFRDIGDLLSLAALAGAIKNVTAKAPGALATLYHGTDAASAERILADGINRAAARELGGGDVFWATADRGIAALFARANPAGRTPAIAGFSLPASSLDSLVRSGAVTIDRTGAYMIKDWNAFNAAVVKRFGGGAMTTNFPRRREDQSFSISARFSLSDPVVLPVVRDYIAAWVCANETWTRIWRSNAIEVEKLDFRSEFASDPRLESDAGQTYFVVVFDGRPLATRWKDWVVHFADDLCRVFPEVKFDRFDS